jgi:NADPH:quinone reductase-like Zn-dependent oxidoreductase
MPAGARFDHAVVCEGAFYANAVLKRIDLKPGHKMLIYGASGAIGTALVQLAKSSGAAVTAAVATRHLLNSSNPSVRTAPSTTPPRISRSSARPSIS